MKKLLFLIVPAALLFSCNQELSADQAKAQFSSQCMNKLAKQFLEADATDEQKTEFCDCYANYVVGDAETITTGEMMKKVTKVEEYKTALEGCAAEAQKAEEVIETVEPEVVEAVEEELEKVADQ